MAEKRHELPLRKKLAFADIPGIAALLGTVYAREERERALEHFHRAKALGIEVPPVVFEELGAKAP